MGLFLIILGLVVWLVLFAKVLGIILILAGILLFFVPAVPYGYSRWRRPPL